VWHDITCLSYDIVSCCSSVKASAEYYVYRYTRQQSWLVALLHFEAVFTLNYAMLYDEGTSYCQLKFKGLNSINGSSNSVSC